MINNYAFFVENTNVDTLQDDNGSTQHAGQTAGSLPSVDSSYWLQPDQNEVTDLCKALDDTQAPSYFQIWKRADNSVYTLTTQVFSGDHPPHRP